MSDLKNTLDGVYEAMQGSAVSEEYSRRHGVISQAILTIYDDETAGLIAEYLEPRIKGKTVIEIGGGIGLTAFRLGLIAKRVYCIEANPMWSWVFAGCLLKSKPKNVSYLFGAADEFVGTFRGDVALFLSHSGLANMRATAAMFAPVVIDVYEEIIALNPSKFDKLAIQLRPFA